MWEHLFLLVLEVAHTPRKIHQTNWRDYVRLTNEGELVRLLLDDRPMLIVAAHLGNFEVGGYVLGLLGFPTYTVARTLDNPYLDRFIGQFRGGTGQRIIPKNGGYDQIVEVLGRGGTMTFLADQYAGAKGCWVEFFGRPASAHKAIALLALDNNARMSVAAARRLDRPMQFELINYAMIDPHEVGSSMSTIRELTQWYTTRLEELIRLRAATNTGGCTGGGRTRGRSTARKKRRRPPLQAADFRAVDERTSLVENRAMASPQWECGTCRSCGRCRHNFAPAEGGCATSNREPEDVLPRMPHRFRTCYADRVAGQCHAGSDRGNRTRQTSDTARQEHRAGGQV